MKLQDKPELAEQEKQEYRNALLLIGLFACMLLYGIWHAFLAKTGITSVFLLLIAFILVSNGFFQVLLRRRRGRPFLK